MLFATKLKNSLTTLAEQHGMEIKVELKNIAVNGQRRGCSGSVSLTAILRYRSLP